MAEKDKTKKVILMEIFKLLLIGVSFVGLAVLILINIK
jgi:uncharacterized membrane protein YqjE